MDTWELVDAQRKDNVALLEGLTPEQWATQSLCSEWTVREVAAHMSTPVNVNLPQFLGLLVKHRLSFNGAAAEEARVKGRKDPAQLVDDYRATIGSRRHPPFAKPGTVLNDMVVHGQDIRRALGLTASIPEERVRASLDFVKGQQPVYGAKKRVAGLKLVATDMDWTHGEGPEVRGPGEALLMILNGRKDALKDLEGDGKATLASRMS
jgi:uncharacterized protein (TIGR03083 family)